VAKWVYLHRQGINSDRGVHLGRVPVTYKPFSNRVSKIGFRRMMKKYRINFLNCGGGVGVDSRSQTDGRISHCPRPEIP
jgi:hypothetical protein